ncbi:FKBP-type peptidyl-prolyl cis-trans isomerase [Alkalitalea saponilacus]|uniref:Peptidyl-prolyl cis-trans isomerase n=1 Tax=Alkalitalea saponilacus TaxID=889453 RepID=A0A1T5D838_9BACT|nr:FKBP-type peptidyl-prolyl cis-trans isomerase [Alkalitalea saponilacus]ASB50613.1 peptidylprolyl isomerase [Alkalitalea saponilacus]SKB67761.1 FKBP-type peptidyl-prolyl cis-trans isomerase [Alkalitalea saponilacus]
MRVLNIIFLISLLFIFCSCSDSQNRQQSQRSSQISRDQYIEINRQLIDFDQRIISQYVDSTGLEMDRTETGLWYKIDSPEDGVEIKTGQIVTLDYNVWLLDGTLCYSSDEDGHKVFMVGHGGVESGLEEGILMLKKGSKATFIMPPHLAHGLIGDDDRIPYRAILKYEVEVLDVKDK